jgi:3-dehydroquinate synthase
VNRIQVRASGRGYEVRIGNGLLRQAGELTRDLVRGPRCAVVSDTNVAPRFGAAVMTSLETAGFQPALITVAAGEKTKSLDQAGHVCDQFSALGLDRSSFIVALGGGVIGDLAGFAAAIFLRGIPHVQIPTTLLAQVDSSIGGKTGVNTAAGKNLLGSIHQPVLVIADTDTLRTLPEHVLNEGFAEVIKHGIIRDAGLFASLKNIDRGNLAPLVRRNVEIKAAIVSADEREENGERALLNFGHTIGHAIEHAAGLGNMLHGEAVSLGIVAASRISVAKAGLPPDQCSEIIAMLESFGLPVRLPENFACEKIPAAILRDKKFEKQRIRFVVTSSIGTASVAENISLADMLEAVAAL